MKSLVLNQLEFNKNSNALILKLFAKISSEEKKKDRGSHYQSLEGLLSHIVGGMAVFFIPCIQKAVENSGLKAYDIKNLSVEEKMALLPEMDDALIKFCTDLEDMKLHISLDFFGRDITLAELFVAINVHNTHHRGQISQILDEMNVQHDLIMLIDKIVPLSDFLNK